MQTLLEHGFLLEYTDSETYSDAKTKIDNLARSIKALVGSKDTMHWTPLSSENCDHLLTCSVCSGFVRFGLYNSKTKVLHRSCSPELILEMDDDVEETLKLRLVAAIGANFNLSPLDKLWRLSIQKELELTDKNGLVSIQNSNDLLICFSDISANNNHEVEEEIKEI